MGTDDNRGGAAGLGDLFNGHGVGQVVAAGAAVLLGERDAQQAQLCQLGDGLAGEALFFVDLLRQRLYLVLRELAVHLAEHLMLFGQREIHFVFSFFCFLQQEKFGNRFCFPFRFVWLSYQIIKYIATYFFRYAEK